MALYQLLQLGLRRLADNAFIPPDPRNRDYQEFLVWQAAGGVPDAIPPDASTLATKDNTFAGDPWSGIGGTP